MNNLIIVESPTKARTLTRFLGEKYKIVASMGHIRDLPKGEFGVDTEHNFEPKYVIPRDKAKNVKLLKEEAKNKEQIILATDPDREGEAIAYHVQYILSKGHKFKRIVFHEITKSAIDEALKNPRQIDLNLFDAQQARRVLDRIVGYRLSPLLWYKIKKGLSAGRVQSVAVRLIVDREREIIAFKPVEFWEIRVELIKEESRIKNQELRKEDKFTANLIEVKSEKVNIKSKIEAEKIVSDLNQASFVVSKVDQKEIKRRPAPPFTTSTLQQTASNKFGFTSRQTMSLAQNLYEEGYITYHRTDSLNIAESAITAVRTFIEKTFGKEYLPQTSNLYKTKAKGAQEAHEAIRPTHIERSEITISEAHKKLYQLILQRFLASQINDAVYGQTTVDITAADYLLRSIGTVVVFPGWRIVYGVKANDSVSENSEGEVRLPILSVSDKLNLLKLIPLQKFTQPPPRFTEASLIKALEENGIGRPSTYAPTISTIQDRGYVIREERKLKPTDMGMMVNDFIVKFFPNIVDLGFTAQMEADLDRIASGEIKWAPVIANFYAPFDKEVQRVKETVQKVVMPVIETGEKCPECSNPLVIRTGKFGKFVACSKFPDCKFTKAFIEKIGMKCPKCQTGEVIVKRTKTGRTFYGCTNYPDCDFASWQKPVVLASQEPSKEEVPS